MRKGFGLHALGRNKDRNNNSKNGPNIIEATYDNSNDGVRMTTSLVPMDKEEVLSYNNTLFAGNETINSMPSHWAVVECRMDPTQDAGNVANCLITGAPMLQQGTNMIRFYQFPGCQGGASFGLTHVGLWANSWGLRGALINPQGNLASNTLLKPSYCQPFGPNSVVDMIVEVSQSIANVYFYVDGRNCGHAYCLDFRHNPVNMNSLRPVVQFTDGACGSRVVVACHPVAQLGVGGAPWRNTGVQPVPGNPCN